MPLKQGLVLEGRYRIASLLGQGGFGAVYRAWDLRLSRPCALKENLDPSPEAERQFGKEAAILANLHHANMPRVTDYFTLPGQGQYLVMDFIEGEDLQEMLDWRGPLPETEALPWIEKICAALAYLHGQTPPIIHRDVKPANIKITPDGQPMLVDFGIAKIYDPVLRTTMGARAVTPGYSPPEQYGRGRTDARSDVYALGATLYALLTGQEPADSVECLIGTAKVIPPRQLNPRISKSVAQVTLKAMAADPAQRFQSAGEFGAALRSRPSMQPPPRPAVAAARPAQVAAPSVGALRPGVSPFPGVRQPKTAKNLAIVTLALGLSSWILIFLCVGYLSAPAALVTGILVLTKYRREATKGDRAMAIIGMISAALLLLGACVMFIIASMEGY